MKVIKNLGRQPYGKEIREKWIVECPICEKHFEVLAKNVKSGKSTKCIVCSASLRKRTHNMSKTRLYNIWNGMKARCSNKNNDSYKNYGGRGISVCELWMKFEPFKDWSLSNGYKNTLSIDRINNDGNYEPNNCRWATRSVQNRNTRRLRNDNSSGFRGVTYNKEYKMWVAQIGIDGKQHRLGKFKYKKDAAEAFDYFVINNGLEHTINDPKS